MSDATEAPPKGLARAVAKKLREEAGRNAPCDIKANPTGRKVTVVIRGDYDELADRLVNAFHRLLFDDRRVSELIDLDLSKVTVRSQMTGVRTSSL